MRDFVDIVFLGVVMFIGVLLGSLFAGAAFDEDLGKVKAHYNEQVKSLEAEYELRAMSKREFMASCLEDRKLYECEVIWK